MVGRGVRGLDHHCNHHHLHHCKYLPRGPAAAPAGLSGQRNLADLQALPRLPGVPGNQVAFYLPTYCYNTTSDTQGRCQPDAVYCVLVAASLAPARSSYYAPSQPLGSYDLVMFDTVIAVDYLISAECLQTRLERDCAIALLRQLDTGPIIIKSRPADSNLVKVRIQVGACQSLEVEFGLPNWRKHIVRGGSFRVCCSVSHCHSLFAGPAIHTLAIPCSQIVAALAILAVAMVLFLYFRRHYRTHQEKRARRVSCCCADALPLSQWLGKGQQPRAAAAFYRIRATLLHPALYARFAALPGTT